MAASSGERAPTARVPYAHIVCCIDDSAASRSALAEARRLRALGPGRLSIVHAFSVPLEAAMAGVVPVLPNMAPEARRWLESQAVAQSGEEPVFLEHGYPPKAVCDWARKIGHPDLIVVAAHRGLVDRAFLGSFAGYLAHHAPCAVLLVRPQPVRV